MRIRFYLAALFLILAVWLQLQWRAAWGWGPDLGLAGLIVLLFFLAFQEFLPLVLLTTWLWGWPPAAGWDVIFLVFVTVGLFWLGRSMPWRPWVNLIFSLILGILAAALFLNFRFILLQTQIFLKDAGLSFLFGILFFWFLRHGLGYRVQTAPVPQRLPIFLP